MEWQGKEVWLCIVWLSNLTYIYITKGMKVSMNQYRGFFTWVACSAKQSVAQLAQILFN